MNLFNCLKSKPDWQRLGVRLGEKIRLHPECTAMIGYSQKTYHFYRTDTHYLITCGHQRYTDKLTDLQKVMGEKSLVNSLINQVVPELLPHLRQQYIESCISEFEDLCIRCKDEYINEILPTEELRHAFAVIKNHFSDLVEENEN